MIEPKVKCVNCSGKDCKLCGGMGEFVGIEICDYKTYVCKTLRLERDRLRAALRKLAKIGTGPCGGGGSLDQYSQGRMEAEKKVRKIARAALK